jgi:hypothetical protein
MKSRGQAKTCRTSPAASASGSGSLRCRFCTQGRMLRLARKNGPLRGIPPPKTGGGPLSLIMMLSLPFPASRPFMRTASALASVIYGVKGLTTWRARDRSPLSASRQPSSLSLGSFRARSKATSRCDKIGRECAAVHFGARSEKRSRETKRPSRGFLNGDEARHRPVARGPGSVDAAMAHPEADGGYGLRWAGDGVDSGRSRVQPKAATENQMDKISI